MDPNHTFTFSHYHMNGIKFSNIFLYFVSISKLKLSKTLKKYFRNTSALCKIPLNTPRNAPNYMCDLVQNLVTNIVLTSSVEYGVPFGAHKIMVPSTEDENITLPSFLWA